MRLTVRSYFQIFKFTNFQIQFPGSIGEKYNKMDKLIKRQKIRYRIRSKVSGTATKPRLSVFRSNAEIYAQLIDDTTGTTIAAASSREKDIVAQTAPKVEKSRLVGAAIARKAIER